MFGNRKVRHIKLTKNRLKILFSYGHHVATFAFLKSGSKILFKSLIY